MYRPDENFNLDKEIRWAKQIRKIIKAIVFMEKGKMTYPKFGESTALQQLSQHLKSVFVSSEMSNKSNRMATRQARSLLTASCKMVQTSLRTHSDVRNLAQTVEASVVLKYLLSGRQAERNSCR